MLSGPPTVILVWTGPEPSAIPPCSPPTTGNAMRHPLRALAGLTVLTVIVAACGGEEVAPFGTGEVTVEPVSQVISTPATLSARTFAATVREAASVDVLAPAVATVERFDVADGTVVTEGQRLGTLRSQALTTSLRQAESTYLGALMNERSAVDALARANATPPVNADIYENRNEEVQILYAEALAEADRLRRVGAAFAEIRAQEILAQQYRTEYDAWVRLNDAVTSASAALRSAEQALDQARAAASDLTLVAPIAGTVRIATDGVAGGGRTLTEGSDVTAAQPIVTVTATGGHRVDLTVPETDLAPVAVGARVAVDLEAFPGTALTGRVTRIVTAAGPVASGVTSATPTSATFVAEVELDGDAGLELRDGLTGTGSLDDLAFGDRYEVTLEVDEVDVVLVAVGQPVSIELDALRATPLTGTIVAIAAAPVRNATGATVYPTRVRLDAPEGAAELPTLRGGLTGTGDVEVERLEAPLAVPSIALLRSGGNEVVFVVRDGAAVEVPVTVLAFGDLRAAIEGDLEPGEQVITTGIERVRDGDPVEVG